MIFDLECEKCGALLCPEEIVNDFGQTASQERGEDIDNCIFCPCCGSSCIILDQTGKRYDPRDFFPTEG